MQQLQQGGSFDDQEYYNRLQKTHETRFKLDSQSANIQRIWKQTGLYETEFLYSNRSSLQIRMSVAPSLDALNVAISGSFVTHNGLAAILAHIMHIAKPLGPSGPSLLQDSFLNSSVALRQALDRVLVQEIVHNIAGSVKFENLTVGEAVDTAKHYFAHQSAYYNSTGRLVFQMLTTQQFTIDSSWLADFDAVGIPRAFDPAADFSVTSSYVLRVLVTFPVDVSALNTFIIELIQGIIFKMDDSNRIKVVSVSWLPQYALEATPYSVIEFHGHARV